MTTAATLSVPGQRARAALGWAAGIVVVALLAWRLDVHPGTMLATARGVPPWTIAGCVLSAVVVFALQSLRWHLVMAPVLRLRYADAFSALVVGSMFNALLPARGGDLLRVQHLGRRTGTSRATILGTEIVDRWLDWWGWIPLLLVAAGSSPMPGWVFKALALFAAALLAGGGAMVVAAWRGHSPRPGSRLERAYRSFLLGVNAFASRRTLFIALAIAPLPWIWETGAIALVGPSFHVHLSFAMALSVLIGLNVAAVVPSPGGVGSMEAGGTAALALFGVGHSDALAFMLVYHATQLLPALVMGTSFIVSERGSLFRAPAAR